MNRPVFALAAELTDLANVLVEFDVVVFLLWLRRAPSIELLLLPFIALVHSIPE